MHQDEVKVFRGNVETHLMRLQELSWRSGEYMPDPVEPALEDEPPRIAPKLPPLRRRLPVPVVAVNLILRVIARWLWVVAIIVVAALFVLTPNQLDRLEPYLWPSGGAIALLAFIEALRQARKRIH